MNILSDGSDFHERIDAVCVQFARELRTASNASTTVSIELLLAQHSDLPRHELLRELLREELEFLQQRRSAPIGGRPAAAIPAGLGCNCRSSFIGAGGCWCRKR
jgi:hypothetical protein